MRSALWAVVAVLALSSASCADGSSDDSNAGAGGAGGGAMTCGNHIVESVMGENCEPGMPVPTNCALLNMGDGMVVCTSQCRLMMMCTGVAQVVGGDDMEGSMGGSGN
jgi:hypothetical protein